MAKKTTRSNTLPFRPGRRGRSRASLIEWTDPSRQAHVLDWRQRAQEFGLAVDGRDEAHPHPPYEDSARPVHDDEPEAYVDQPIAEGGDEEELEDDERAPQAGVSREDVDLVRVYLQHIGKRRLLKAHQEREIGERIEAAQRNVVAAMADIPGAVQTLISLADRIRTKGAPANELILLPEGGELQDEHIVPVLKAFARIKRRRGLARQSEGEARAAAPRREIAGRARAPS